MMMSILMASSSELHGMAVMTWLYGYVCVSARPRLQAEALCSRAVRPFVRPSVCLSVRLLPNLLTQYFEDK